MRRVSNCAPLSLLVVSVADCFDPIWRYSQVTVVYDLEGMSMKHFYRPFVSAYSELCELFETLYPECLSKVC